MTPRLWITEKRSAAINLAAGVCLALNVTVENKATIGRDGFMRLSNGEVITYLEGHLLTTKFLSPEHKEARQDTFFDFLPIVVKNFEYEPSYEKNKDGTVSMSGGRPVPKRQYTVVMGLIKSARSFVNAGDVDREGQLIVDELFIHSGVDPEGKDKPIWRLPLVSDRAEDIRDQVLNLTEKNGDAKWVRRRQAALARAYCDAAVGFNGSMAYQAATGFYRASVGRVQTPVLCLIVDREAQVSSFTSRTFFVPLVTMTDGTELRFFKREDAKGQPGFDEEGRIIDENVAKRICAIIASGMPGKVLSSKCVKGTEPPPLPFSATVLASTVSKRTGMLPTQAEAAAQTLYERHKAITYVGTDCRHLPTSKLDDVPAIMSALSRLYPQQVGGSDLNLRSKAWNDAKVDEHFAIIPTGKLPQSPTPEEQAVYDAVVTRFVAQFYPSCEFETNQLIVLFGADEFRATRKEITRMGWKEIEGHLEQGGPKSEDVDQLDDSGIESTAAGVNVAKVKFNIDAYKPGQSLRAVSATHKSGRTTAPTRFDMATILDAMLTADTYAKSDEDRKILRLVEGIGTSRTRQGIVDKLVKSGLLSVEKKGKRHELRPGANGIATQLRSKLPPILCDVSMTAKWELGFSMIEKGTVDWRQIVDRTYGFVEEIVAQAKSQVGSFKPYIYQASNSSQKKTTAKRG